MERGRMSENPWTIAQKRAQAVSSTRLSPSDKVPRVSLLSLPLEICTQIASYLSSTAIGRLTRSCRGTYQLFNPALYHTIHSVKHSESLLRTLGSVPGTARLVRVIHIDHMAARVPRRPYLFPPVRRKDVQQESSDELKSRQKAMVTKALRNLFEASLVKSFSWRSNLPFNTLTLYAKPVVKLPANLETLSITPIEASIEDKHDLKFISGIHDMHALNSFAYEEDIMDVYKPDRLAPDKGLFRFVLSHRAVHMSMDMATFLHNTRLRTLKLAFNFNHPARDVIYAADLLSMLLTTINSMRFPLLQTVSLHVQALTSNRSWAYFDLRPFLNNHPGLTDVAIDLQGLPLDTDALPDLRRFECLPWDSLTVLGSERPLEALKLWMPFNELEPVFRAHDFDDNDREVVFHALSLTTTLRDLSLIPDNIRFTRIEQYWGEIFVDDDFIPRLVESCPYLRRLELYSQNTAEEAFKALQGLHFLQELELHLWQWLERPDKESTSDVFDELGEDQDDLHMRPSASLGLVAEDIFKREGYWRQIHQYLFPSMAALEVVQVEVFGAVEPQWECSLNDHPAFPQVQIQYEFLIETVVDEDSPMIRRVLKP